MHEDRHWQKTYSAKVIQVALQQKGTLENAQAKKRGRQRGPQQRAEGNEGRAKGEGVWETPKLDAHTSQQTGSPTMDPDKEQVGFGNHEMSLAGNMVGSESRNRNADDKVLYESQLAGNPFFDRLTDREKGVLLWTLCQNKFPGHDELMVGLESSLYRAPTKKTGISPCLVPNSKIWLASYARFVLGVEALLMQGADPTDFPSLRPGAWSNSFLQDLAGNAFCTPQFAAWFLSTLRLPDKQS